ncbi:hypothetical protein AALO_G00014330 [Alosa alosa]|uniref:Teneurin-like YD-shell domain-containing protein n=1 Tax=Alosa alosa TaxID=278164 RepID=A0AAV6HGT6_9TELE|nr:hypothetical protein AALO_G00014330 [Alosa alosa]
MSVNLTYSSTGQVTCLQRGPTSERVEYDSQGRIVSRTFADGKTWSYTYLDKKCRSGADCSLTFGKAPVDKRTAVSPACNNRLHSRTL